MGSSADAATESKEAEPFQTIRQLDASDIITVNTKAGSMSAGTGQLMELD